MEIYLSVAAIVFYAKKTGVEFRAQGASGLSFNNNSGQYYFCRIMPGKEMVDCGYIVLNSNDYEILFGKNMLPVDLSNNETVDLKMCERPRQVQPDGNREHCRIAESLWRNIETEISPGKSINCVRRE